MIAGEDHLLCGVLDSIITPNGMDRNGLDGLFYDYVLTYRMYGEHNTAANMRAQHDKMIATVQFLSPFFMIVLF